MKKFNVNGVCYPDRHYMTNLHNRLQSIRLLVDEGNYFVINRARQYGKTTTLWALKDYLQNEYCVVFINFQQLSTADYRDEYTFTSAFADLFAAAFPADENDDKYAFLTEPLSYLQDLADGKTAPVGLRRLFNVFSRLCRNMPKPVVLLVDEVDTASNNQVFLDFLAQLRAYYLSEDRKQTFWSVILAGVYDVKNLKVKIRPDSEHQYNSPWNIAADFNIDMSLDAADIAEMLAEYEQDHHLRMDVPLISGLLYEYTSGYPYFVSRLCKILDENISRRGEFPSLSSVWTESGITEAVKDLLAESNTLFDDMIKKLNDYPELRKMLYSILFHGERISYNVDSNVISLGSMFGFLRNNRGIVAVSNRIFETRLYNLFLSEDMLNNAIYKAGDLDKNQFVQNGRLDMELILTKFAESFTDIYSDANQSFLEDNGRRFFLLYLKPIINGVGNYYIEARTRDMRRTDVIIDYRGKQYFCEMKIWHGNEYHRRGEQQLIQYLEDYHLTVGYMLSFNFNKNKQVGVQKIYIDGKTIIEAVV